MVYLDSHTVQLMSMPLTVSCFSKIQIGFTFLLPASPGSPGTHTHPFYGPFSGNTQVSQYQKSKTSLDFTEARDSEWQWHQLGRMQVCTSFQADNHASTPPLSFLQAGCPSCCPTNSIKALKAFLVSPGKGPLKACVRVCVYLDSHSMDIWIVGML